MQKIESILFEILMKISKIEKVTWYLTGSIAEKSYDEFSNLNLIVDSLNDKVTNILKSIKCNFFYDDNYNNLKVFEYKGLIITIQNIKFVNKNCIMVPVNKYLESQLYTGCYRRFIPYFADKNKFKMETKESIDKIFLWMTKVIIAYGRRDELLFDKSISNLSNCILELCEYVTKNGWHIDNNRIMPYLHDSIVKVFLIIKYHNFLFYENSINNVFAKIADVIMIFNVMLYEVEEILQTPVNTVSICNVLKRHKIDCIEIGPQSDECLSKYNLEVSNVYDIYRDDFVFSQKLQKALKPIIGGKNIFEIGVGTGMIAEKIIPYSLTYTGLENSVYMLKKFREKCNSNYTNVFFILADMMNIDQFISDTYDVYLERASLMFCIDPLNVIDKLVRMAKKGAVFLRLDIEEDNNNDFNIAMKIFDSSITKHDRKPIVLKEFDEIKLVNQFLTSKGLNVRKIKLFEWEYKIKIQTMVYSLKNKCIPYICKFSEEAISYGIECVKKYFICKKYDKDTELVVQKTMFAYITKF